jgi:oligopeptide/dipeptide ABC transporter ATP-binding protein
MTAVDENTSSGSLLDVQGLSVSFSVDRLRQPVLAVDDVTFSVAERETVGLVGESGSGKTTIGRAILGLTPIADGEVSFAGTNIERIDRRSLSSQLQVVFQDPYSSLNPTRTIGQTLSETLRPQGRLAKSQLRKRVSEALTRVGLGPEAAEEYPAHFSGGQRQRIAVARALIVQPRLVILDEPTSSLDLSIQAQVLNLLRTLQNDLGLSYLFISHDLAVVRHLSHRIIVLYHGQIMEQGEAKSVADNPTHPYTRELFDAALAPDPEKQRARAMRKKPAEEATPLVGGCPFAPRCEYAVEVCRLSRPNVETTPEGTLVACHRWREIRSTSGGPVALGSERQRISHTGIEVPDTYLSAAVVNRRD